MSAKGESDNQEVVELREQLAAAERAAELRAELEIARAELREIDKRIDESTAELAESKAPQESTEDRAKRARARRMEERRLEIERKRQRNPYTAAGARPTPSNLPPLGSPDWSSWSKASPKDDRDVSPGSTENEGEL